MPKIKTKSPPAPTAKKPVPIVAIGASAGGLEAMMQLLKSLSPTTGIAYIYIQHLDPSHASLLSTILARHTTMRVMEAEHLMHVEPDCVYVIPPNKVMESIDGVLTLDPRKEKPALNLPVNQFFISLAERQQEGAIGIVLSGTGKDGTLGLRAIRAAGGVTLAQDDSAKFDGMPQSAIAEGVVDMVLSPEKIAEELERLSKYVPNIQKIIREEEEGTAVPDADTEVKDVLHLVKKASGVDFSYYKMATVKRRIARRMLLHQLDTLPDYVQHLQHHDEEARLLYDDLLINVTRFFRDTDTLDYLTKTLLPDLLSSRKTNDPIRIWVPGCSTGEEAYSLAIVLTEALGERARDAVIQIFATDLSEKMIAKARLGTYKAAELLEVSPQRLKRFFTKTNNGYHIIKSIRDYCIFAPHNIFKDPPFPRLDLISCCNLFIYLNAALQMKILATFHYALKPTGRLILGKSETIGAATQFFEQLDKKYKVYGRKSDSAGRALLEMNRRLAGPTEKGTLFGQKKSSSPEAQPKLTLEMQVDNILLQQFIPPTVLVTQDLEILQFRGATGLFLEPTSGKATLNLLKLVRPELGFELRSAVHKCGKSGKRVQKSGIPMQSKGHSYLVGIQVVPFKSELEERLFLIVFDEQSVARSVAGTVSARTDHASKQSADELATLREEMRFITETQEANNEELQAANEEAVASNEELQSLNEELETSKEEIEATNEELLATNQELQVRTQQLTEAYEYSEAVFSNLRESLVVLDVHLHVKAANQVFYRTFQTNEKDTVGQMIYKLGNRQWDIPQLRRLLEEIIPQNNQFHGLEVSHTFPGIGEKVMLLNAHKIVQEIHQQELIVLAIEDITAQRSVMQLAVFRDMANDAPVMIWVADLSKDCVFFNNTWLQFTGRRMEQEVGNGWAEGVHPDDLEHCLHIYTSNFDARTPFKMEYRLRRHDGEYRWMLDVGKPSFSSTGEFTGYIGSCTDIHDRKILTDQLDGLVRERTQELDESNAQLKRSNQELEQFAYVASHDLQEPLRKILTFSGRLEKRSKDILPAESQEDLERIKVSIHRMSVLIEDLLNFSRVSRQEKNFFTTDLNKVVEDIVQDFDLLISEKKARVEVQRLPVIQAIPVQMTQLFQNLLGNALKFSVPQRTPVITISAQVPTLEEVKKHTGGTNPKAYRKIIIHDNGIGLDPQFAEQIFVIFQRLHGKQDYPGTGIGLAICKRIANNHGGDIYVESKEGEGATFNVILQT